MLALLTSGLAWVAHSADNGLLRQLLEVKLAVNLIDLRSSPSFDVASLARCASALSCPLSLKTILPSGPLRQQRTYATAHYRVPPGNCRTASAAAPGSEPRGAQIRST
jgi:hypothetical protein